MGQSGRARCSAKRSGNPSRHSRSFWARGSGRLESTAAPRWRSARCRIRFRIAPILSGRGRYGQRPAALVGARCPPRNAYRRRNVPAMKHEGIRPVSAASNEGRRRMPGRAPGKATPARDRVTRLLTGRPRFSLPRSGDDLRTPFAPGPLGIELRSATRTNPLLQLQNELGSRSRSHPRVSFPFSAVFFGGRRICAGAIARAGTPQNLVGALVPMCRGRYGVFRSTYEIPIIGDRPARRQRTLAMAACHRYRRKVGDKRGPESPEVGFPANPLTGFSAKITRFSVKNIPFPRLPRSGHSFCVIQAALAFRIPLRRPNWRPNSETVCPFTMLRTKADQTNQSEQTDRDRKSG